MSFEYPRVRQRKYVEIIYLIVFIGMFVRWNGNNHKYPAENRTHYLCVKNHIFKK